MTKGLRESLWVSRHQSEMKPYEGRWIAVSGGRVAASGKTLREVMAAWKAKGLKGQPLVTKIPRKDEALYVLSCLPGGPR
jgi:hypothetical protein